MVRDRLNEEWNERQNESIMEKEQDLGLGALHMNLKASNLIITMSDFFKIKCLCFLRRTEYFNLHFLL